MKIILHILILIYGLLISLSWSSEDVLFLKNGKSFRGKIISHTPPKIILEIPMGQGSATIPFTIDQIDSINLGVTVDEEILLQAKEPAALNDLQAFYRKRQVWFGFKGSDTGDVVLTMISVLLSQKTKTSANDAIFWINTLQQNDWNPERKKQAEELLPTALILAGKNKQAEALLSQSTNTIRDQDLLLTSLKAKKKISKAKQLFQQVLKLENEFPRWELIPDKRTLRLQLLNQALDEALTPYLLFTDSTDESIDGVRLAAKIYLHDLQNEQALQLLESFQRLNPKADFENDIKRIQHLKQSSQPSKKGKT